MTIDVVFRNEKGDELTWEEMDGNLANLKVAIETKKDDFSILPVAQGGTGVATLAEAKQVLEVPEFANQIEYMPAGTGAVATDVQSKLRQIVNIHDKGVSPSASAASNNAAMQLLMDEVSAAGGGVISAGPGTYNFLGLKPKSGVLLKGVPGKTIFKLDDSASTGADLFGHNSDGLDGSLDDFGLDGLILDGNHKDAAFVAYGCQRLRFSKTIFRNAGTYGCALQARPGYTITLPQDDIVMIGCGFEDNGSDAPGWDGIDIKWGTNVKLIGCWADRNTDVGINVRGLEVDIVGCTADGNATAGILCQSNDSTADSAIRISGGGAFGTTAGPGLELQGNSGNDLHVMVSGFQSYENSIGVRVSGSGKVYGKLDIQSRNNTSHGLHVTGDYIGNLSVSGLIANNGGDGVNTAGKNTIFDAAWIIGNSGTGYREGAGADNNYLMTNCVVSGNTVADIGTRVGGEISDGFMSVRSKYSMRAFPGGASGLELQTDSGGTHSSVAAVGDATSIDLRLISKGNGDIALYKDNGSRLAGLFRESGSATVNYPDFIASTTGTPVQLKASGTDSNIDIQLTPTGTTGRIRFGTLTGTADAPITGYIEIKDAAGTVRKLAVIS